MNYYLLLTIVLVIELVNVIEVFFLAAADVFTLWSFLVILMKFYMYKKNCGGECKGGGDCVGDSDKKWQEPEMIFVKSFTQATFQ